MRQQLRLLPFCWLLLAALTVSACQPTVAAVDAVTCISDFEATVQQGPSAGLRVEGRLLFSLDHTGALTGGVATQGEMDIPVVGQANGRAINLAFKVAEKKFLFGVGSAELPIYTCSGYWGGGFTGPEPGDSGDWLAADGHNILDPNFVGALDEAIDPEEINPASGETITVTLPGGNVGGTINFTCGETTCTCVGTQDCVDLVETKLCKEKLKGEGETRTCPYR